MTLPFSRGRTLDLLPPTQRYTRTAYRAASAVIRSYSTSFSFAASLLPKRMERSIASLYAVVRIADEIVDGAYPAGPAAQAEALDDFRLRIADACRTGFSSDLIAHAFADTARRTGIGPKLWDPFFSSMYRDIRPEHHSPVSLDSYIHGSAEVIGLMCLAIFMEDENPTAEEQPILEDGARGLGAAFQRVNFLRDLGSDTAELGRTYLVDSEGKFTEEEKARQLDIIQADFAAARKAMPLLPWRVRTAVGTALGIFEELAERVAATPVAELQRTRLRIPAPRKAVFAARAAAVRGWSGA